MLGEGSLTREEEEEEEKMQANPAYLPIEMMSYKSPESKYVNVPICIPQSAHSIIVHAFTTPKTFFLCRETFSLVTLLHILL